MYVSRAVCPYYCIESGQSKKKLALCEKETNLISQNEVYVPISLSLRYRIWPNRMSFQAPGPLSWLYYCE